MQTSYAEMAPAFAGMLADATKVKHADTFVQGEAAAEIPFGVAVAIETSPGTDGTPGKATLVNNVADKVAGIVLHSHAYDKRTELGTTGLKPKTTMAVLRKGRVWVRPETAVVDGDRGYVRAVAGAGGTQLGALRNAAVGGETIDSTGQIVFRSTAAAGGLAIAEVDFTNKPA